MICSICKSNNTDLLLDYGQYPYFTVPLKKNDKKKILAQYSKDQLVSKLKYTACKDCGHVYINQIPDQNIIDDLYSNYYSYPSPLKGEFDPIRDNRFIQIFQDQIHPICKKDNLDNVLEVGCYDGYILNQLQKDGYNVTGCDPSVGADIGLAFGLNIQKEFFDPINYSKNGSLFDIVISRHFIEHTINPYEFINSLKSVLFDNGLLILETPNIQYFIKKGLLEVFSLQHITLFTATSLKILMIKAGLDVILIQKTFDNLIVIAKKSNKHDSINLESFAYIISQFTGRVIDNNKRINNQINNYLNSGNDIAIWGAGGFGIAALTLYSIPSSKIKYFIDSDPKKWGMEYLNYKIPIISPEKAKQLQPDLIIITSMYSQSIKRQIKGMNFQSSVLTMFQ